MAIAEIAIQANHNETASQILEHVIREKYHLAAAIHSSMLLKENQLTKARQQLIQYIGKDPTIQS